MTFQEAITNARSELGDTYVDSYTYADADMLRYAVEGVREAWAIRPSLKYDESTGVLYEASMALPSVVEDYFDLPLPESVHQAIVYYIVYGCLSRDVTDENNASVAEIAKSRFAGIVTG